MSAERAQCGLTSLLPMSCRGRAEAFARRLHTRLRNLGSADREDAGESRWLAAAGGAVPRRDSDLFFDFELECESPSSPVDDCPLPFPERSPSDDGDVPFYDVDSEVEAAAAPRPDPEDAAAHDCAPPTTNGFTFSSAFYTDRSPIKSQPTPRENGFADGRLYSAITFDDCERRDTAAQDVDETDCALRLSPPPSELSRPAAVLCSTDSDSDFESAKSEPDAPDRITASNTVTQKCDDDRVSDCLPDHSKSAKEQSTEHYNNIEASSISEQETSKEVNGDEVLKVEVMDSTASQTMTTVIISQIEEESPLPEPTVEETTSLAVAEVAEEAEAEEEERPQRVRRCSSLKTGKTPPGTPGRKKIVRFADVLGLDLADVKTFMDEVPVIPNSAYNDLSNADVAFGSPPTRPAGAGPRPGALALAPLFQVPRDINEALEARCVCLETARAADGAHLAVCGSVRVRNLDFHKTVHVRYTMDGWKTYTDLQATYVAGSCDGFSDRFQFLLYTPAITAGRRLELAVRFQCKGRQYWDSNFGVNYCFECLPLGAPLPPPPARTVCARAPPLHPTRDWHPSFY